MTPKLHATIHDLHAVAEQGKAELVDGEVVIMSPTGDAPARAGGRVFASLLQYELHAKGGWAYPDNVGFLVDLPHRQSFSPDAAFYVGQRTGMKFLQGAPIFAVEVRSEHDYGPQAERELAKKRGDYFDLFV